jgi:hypothetical protein
MRTAHAQSLSRRNMTTTLETTTIGTEHINGTDWPVLKTLTRQEAGGKRTIYTVTTIVNGMARATRAFTTKRAALSYYKG